MSPFGVFLNDAGRLRSGWRVGIFVLVLIPVSLMLAWLIRIGFALGHSVPIFSHPLFNDITYRFVLLGSAVVAAWVCLRFLEGLPLRSLGLGLHQKWWWDLSIGSLIGIASLLLAALIAFATGGLRFTFSGSSLLSSTLRSLLASGVLFIVGALAEEAMFRGYPLQTLTRAKLAWLGILLTSLPFALVHLNNPNVVAGFTFINTALAGLWLALAYLKTRSLWFPLGVHWAWNWALNSVLGLPVSGLKLTSQPLFLGTDLGPAWLTGGSYGIEGGLACTLALVISILFIWRTRLVAATPDMLKLTSEENPTSAPELVLTSPSNG